MASLQDQVKDVCRLADAVVKNPSTSVSITASNIGVCDAVAGFAAGGGMVFASSILVGPSWLVIILVRWMGKKKQQEKERMLREVIRKQQEVIQKLNQEQEKSRQQQEKNRQEIENLKEVLRMLEGTEKYLNAA